MPRQTNNTRYMTTCFKNGESMQQHRRTVADLFREEGGTLNCICMICINSTESPLSNTLLSQTTLSTVGMRWHLFLLDLVVERTVLYFESQLMNHCLLSSVAA